MAFRAPPGGQRAPTPLQPYHPRPSNVLRHSSLVGEGPMLGPQLPHHAGRHLLVLDLDETLVHAQFVEAAGADYVLSGEWGC